MSRWEPAPNLDEILADATKQGRANAAAQGRERAAQIVNRDTGWYADRSLRVFDDDRGVGFETTDFAGHIIEWGGGNTTPQAPIRRAADTLGRFKEA